MYELYVLLNGPINSLLFNCYNGLETINNITSLRKKIRKTNLELKQILRDISSLKSYNQEQNELKLEKSNESNIQEFIIDTIDYRSDMGSLDDLNTNKLKLEILINELTIQCSEISSKASYTPTIVRYISFLFFDIYIVLFY